MLSLNTQIPTVARGQVRSLVKAHPDWSAFLTEKGIISAAAKNSELLEFALRHPELAAKIEATLNLDANASQGPELPETVVAADVADVADAVAMPMAAGFNADSVLSSVDQFLSPLVRNELSKALGPVIDAANKPAIEIERTVEVERIVEVERAAGDAPRVVTAKARRDKKTTFRTLFPSKARDAWRDAPITLWTGVKSPDADPFYVPDHQQMAMLLTAIERGTNVWLAGPAGTGKSTMPAQACSILGRPFVKIGMTRQTEVESLVGGMGMHNSSTIWEDGVLTKAMRQPGTVILIDELTLAPAGVQAIIQLVADDHRSMSLPTGEVVKAADGVVFIVADNTTGCGDEGGLYAGTNISNAALVTRFKRMIIVDYLPVAKETEALANHTACPIDAARHVAEFVANVRRLPALQGVVVSLRQMVGLVQMMQDGFTSKEAFVCTISSRMPATERAAIEALADLTWNKALEALMAGKPVPAAPSNSPAAQAFGDQQY
jgi:MoxR-like ATPase